MFRIGELASLCIKREIAVLAIQEHRIFTDTPDVSTIDVGHGWEVRLSSASKSGQGGVGFLLSPSATHAFTDITIVSSRILKADFKSRNGLTSTIFSIYGPTATHLPEDVSNFFSCLGDAISNTPLGNMLFVLGDFNATYNGNFSPVSSSNNNAPFLTELLSSEQLTHINSRFQKNIKKLVTFHGPNNRKVALHN
jgi:exonuclease III